MTAISSDKSTDPLAAELEASRTEIAGLRRSVESYQGILTMLRIGVVVHAPDTSILYGNAEASQILGLSPEQMAGKAALDPAWQFVREDGSSLPVNEYPVNRVLASLELLDAFVLGVDRPATGDRVWVQVRAFPDFGPRRELLRIVVTFGDITERKRAEEELHKSESRYRQLFDAIPESVLLIGTDRRVVAANRASARLYGYESPQQLEGFYTPHLIAEKDRERAARIQEELVQGEERSVQQYTEVRHDGSEFVAEVMSTALHGPEQDVLGYIGITRDITALVEAQEKLRESNELLSRFVSNSPIYAFIKAVTPTESRVLQASDNFLQMIGLSGSEILGKTMGELFPPELAAKMTADDLLVAATGQVLRLDEELNGRSYETIKFPVVLGERTFLAGYTTDTTERKRAEAEVLETSWRLQFALRAGHLGVWDWNLKKNIMVWDDEMLALYGLTREQFPGGIEAWNQGLHPEDRERAIAECQAAIDGSRDFDTEFRILQPNGTVRHVKAGGLVLRDEGGTPIRMLGLNQDITERRQAEAEKAKLEAQLQQAQKMESVGRLAGGVAHDFNNMLGVILGHAEMAVEKVDQAEESLRGNLEEIRKAAERSANLTRQLLAFARKQTVAPKVLDLNESVASMFKMLRRLVGEGVNLVWLPCVELYPVKVDPSQVDQILANLCVNARDAIGGVGKLTIETANCTFDDDYCATHAEVVPGDYVKLAVTDDGCGMDKATQDRLFEPFFTTKDLGKGTGLGLATVYGIVKQNNGFIKVDSEPGKGTTFEICLPRHVAGKAATVQSDPLTGPVARGRETILVVEDEPAILRMTKTMLERLGYAVLTASTPGEAIRVAGAHTDVIHLLITDVVMPEMNGRDLAKNLLTLYPALKRLFMSGYTADVIAHHGVLDEGVHFIQKPFSKKDLAARVSKALERG